MMEALRELVRNVAVLVILTMLLQMLLPEGKLSGFVRMIMGLLLLSAILSPLLDFFGNQELAPVYSKSTYETSSTQEIINNGQSLAAELNAQANAEYQEGLERQISALVKLLPQVSQVEIEVAVDGTGEVTQIEIRGVFDPAIGNKQDTEARLKEIIKDFFVLSPETVIVDMRAG